MNRINKRLRKMSILKKKANKDIYNEVKEYIKQNWKDDCYWHDNNKYFVLDRIPFVATDNDDYFGMEYKDALKEYFEDNIDYITERYCNINDINCSEDEMDEDDFNKFIKDNYQKIFKYFEEHDALEIHECEAYTVLTYNPINDCLSVEQCSVNLTENYDYSDGPVELRSLGDLKDLVFLLDDGNSNAEDIVNKIISKVKNYKVDIDKI